MKQVESKNHNANEVGRVQAPDPEVRPRVGRRTFSVGYKRAILAEADQSTEVGAVGALLRREGLYSSQLSQWREQQKKGELDGLAARKRGRKANQEAAELADLRRENGRLRGQLEQAELIMGAQKKLAQAFENAWSQRKGGSS